LLRRLQLANGVLPWPSIDPEKALPWVAQRVGLSLAESQIAAIRLALISKVLVITGGPGVGKTTSSGASFAYSRRRGPDLPYAPLLAVLLSA
jgi:exodeoxyribonuclease V alpha subunit